MYNHPKIDLPTSKFVTVCNGMTLFLFIGTLIYVWIVYPQLPDSIPTHFNLQGNADSWGQKGSILIVPLTMLPCMALLYFLSKAPHLHNYSEKKLTDKNAPELYAMSRMLLTVLNVEIALMTFYVTWSDRAVC